MTSAAVFAGVACGPGLESMHESNLRFEHCYRLDMDAKIAAPHREYCWRDWTQTYAYGQPLDRVEYARRRIVQLESGDQRLVRIQEDNRPEERVFEEVGPEAPIAAPAPTSAHEPPPKTEPAPMFAGPGAADRPGSACATQCNTALTDCAHLCENKQADCAACREDYRHCMRRCFE